MIWYRHWLEMRLGLIFLVGLGAWSGLTVTGPFHSLEFGQPLPLTPLGQAIGADQVLVWAEFAGRILPFSLVATLTLAGAGFRTLMLPKAASPGYTLTLPISRGRLVWTRLGAGLALATALAVLLTVAGVVWFRIQGQTVPIAPVLESLALGVVLLATMLAIMSAVVTMLSTWWAFVGFFGIVALAIPNSYVVSAPARGEVPWLALGAYVVGLVVAVTLTARYISSREY